MELIDRYVKDVGRRLPPGKRDDVAAELRSLLHDTLDDRVEGTPTEDDVVALLKEFGSPAEVAQRYRPSRQLIGPELFPVFRLVMIIVLAAVSGGLLIAYIVGSLNAGGLSDFAAGLPELLLTLLQAGLSAFGSVVLVFLVLDYFGVRPEFMEKDWNPRDLPDIKDVDVASRVEAIAGIVILTFFVAGLNIFRNRIGFVMTIGEPPLLNEAFLSVLPWITVSMLMGIAMNVVLFLQGRWYWYTRIVKFVLDIFGVYVFSRVAQAVEGAQGELLSAGFDATFVEYFVKGLHWFVVLLAIIITVDFVKVLVQTVIRNENSPVKPIVLKKDA